jgi:hypothetical protein
MTSKLEPEFKKTTGYCYSEQGHNYQLTYSTNAARNSSAVLFIPTVTGWYALKKYDSITDSGIKVFKDSAYFPTRGTFMYAFGHKINFPLFKRYMEDALIERDYSVGCLYTPALAPGLSEFVKTKCLNFNSSYSLENKMTSGLTILNITGATSVEQSASFIVYPNGKIMYGPICVERSIEEEETAELLSTIAGKTITPVQINLFEGNYLKQFIQTKRLPELMGWECYHINPLTRTIVKL